ncbi:MAG TPA: YraN family protein [Nevskiaceae bacterium]|nr:YraN family protein [Nevskiaceae bacterium]
MKGAQEENLALAYLQAQKMQLVERNYRCRGGELDLVMRERDMLVIVEVRKRGNPNFGSAAESVTGRKQARIVHAAQSFLASHSEFAHCPVRFDVIALDAANRIEWLPGAFDA